MAFKVLLADPNPTTQKVVELTLEGEEAELISAQSGQEALDKAERERPDVILFSENLDDMGAFQFHQQLKERPELRETPCVALISGRGVTPEQLQEWGISHCLEKPFEAQELMDKIDQALRVEVVVDQEPTPEEGAVDAREEEAEEESAEVTPEAADEEEDFTITLKALSDQVLQEQPETEKGEPVVEDEVAAAEQLSAQSEGLEMEEGLLAELEEVKPEDTYAPQTTPQPPEGDRAASPPKLEGFGQALGQYLMEAAQRTLDETMERVLKECVDKALEDMQPGLMEAARQQLERFLPLMAEVVIRQEIERLKESLQREES